jgi:tetratricopeptide (TPR) repeat protein
VVRLVKKRQIESSNWYVERANQSTTQEIYDEFIDRYDRALKFRPDRGKFWNSLSISLRLLDRYKESIDNYDRAIVVGFGE